MCGIFGISSRNKVNAAQIIRDGLKRLEYRGYDSWGISVLNADQIMTLKLVGSIPDSLPKELPKVRVGIGHTRWATHGGVTQVNAHPHEVQDGSFCLAHNGILENYEALQQELAKKGRRFVSQTDTEVIVGLLEQKLLRLGDSLEGRAQAVRTIFKRLEGRNTIIVLTKYGEILAARNGSPLVVGKNDHDFFVASDTLSLAPFATEILTIENNQMVIIHAGVLKLVDIITDKPVAFKFTPLALDKTVIDKKGYDHYMLKEIFETPRAIQAVSVIDQKKLIKLSSAILKARTVYTIGSGTAGIAAAQTAFFLRSIAKINTKSLIGAEAKEYVDLFTSRDIIIAPSQSGETADVLEILEAAKAIGVTIATFTNMPGSSMERMANHAFLAQAGPEICVMSTKVYSAMQAFGFLLAHAVEGNIDLGLDQLTKVEQSIQAMLLDEAQHNRLKKLAHTLVVKEHIFLLGKGQNRATVHEGMVKIVEGSYRHAHAIAAGDLKHYAITIIEKGVPVIFVIANDTNARDMMSAVHEVKARGGEIIGFAPEASDSFDVHNPIPDLGDASALAAIVPLQLLAYYMAVDLGNNVDKPRNIAKSVTVK